MKKIITLLFALSVLLASASVFASEKALTKADVAKEIGLLKSIGIVDDIPESTEGNEPVSRADFVWYASKILNVSDTEQKTRYFLDMPMDHWALNGVNIMAERNIISIPDDKLFRPNDKITENEAVKILISILGYGDYAQITGGYPGGYSEIASRLKFTYTGSNKDISLYQALVMIYDTLNSCVYEKKHLAMDYINYEESDKTLLAMNFDVYTAEGVVMQSGGVSLSGEPIKGKNSSETARIVKLDREEYTSDINLYDYLGTYITVYYLQKDKDDIPHIIYKECKKDADVIELNEEEFIKYEGGKLYYYNDNSKRKVISVPASAVIVKNGMLKNTNIENEIKLNKGIIRIVDNNNDNKADYVFINEYINVFTEVIDTESQKIYDAVIPGRSVDLNSEKKIVTIENSSGKNLDFSALKKGQLLTIYDSDTHARVIINSDSISAKIYENAEENDKLKIEVGKSEQDRTWYEVDEEYYREYIKANASNGYEADINLKPGAEITYWKDAFGRIAYITGPDDGNWSFCYLIKVGYDEDSEHTTLKVFMQTGKMEVVTVENKAVLDGTVVKSNSEILAGLNKVTRYGKTLTEGEDEVKGQIIRIKKNSSGNVAEIDTEYNDSDKEGRLSLKRSQDYDRWMFWFHANGFVQNGNSESGKQMFYNNRTVRFVVPKHTDLENATDEDFGIMTGYYTGQGGLFYVEGFKLDLEAGHESVIVNYQDHSTYETVGPYLVESVAESLNADGDIVLVADVYTAAGGDKIVIEAKEYDSFNFSKTVKQADGTVKEYTDRIGKGDFIEASVNNSGKIVSVTVYYDYSEEKDLKQSLGWKNGGAVQSEDTQLVSAYIKNINDGIAYLWYEGHLTEDDLTGSKKNAYNHAARIQTGAALVFDGKNIRKSTLSEELIAASSLGYEDAKPYFLTTRYTKITSAVLYKDN